ncbi:hypothetical protein MMC34_008241 [Xylographa carneopallida]|nr:hypothetical protein [Xylographa carneopallida]
MYLGNDRTDVETGFMLQQGASGSSTLSAWKDALFGTTQRKIVTGVSALLLLVFVLTTAILASRDNSSSVSNYTPGSTPSDANPCPTGCKSGILPTNYTAGFVNYTGSPSTSPASMPVNLTIGYTADTYITEDTMRIYAMMKAEGASLIAISGDLDYIGR